MAVDDQTESGFQAAEEVELRDYRPLSGLAILGLVLGLASVVAFFSTIFWIVPVVAFLINLAALRQVAASTTAYVGGGAARIGLCLAVVCGTAAVAHDQARNWILRQQARNVGQHWFQYLLDEKLALAHQLTLAADSRETDAQLVSRAYVGNPVLGDDLQSYREQDGVQFLLSLHGKATIDYVMTHDQESTGREDVLLDVYRVGYDKDGKPQSRLVGMLLSREARLRDNPTGWRVNRVELDFDPDKPL